LNQARHKPIQEAMTREELNRDPQFCRWRDAYPGHADFGGPELSIEQVVPGFLSGSIVVGYMPAESPEQALSAWEWKWINPKTA
jgi:hypothetical protein